MEMTWNHRLIKHDLKKPTYLAVHEVYYDGYKISSWTTDPIDLTGNNKAEIKRLLSQITIDVDTPILSEKDLLKKFDNNLIKLNLTCPACPEQYDAFMDGEQVGYLRLRHGEFRVDFPDCGGGTIYEAHPKGDGAFDDDEREFYLNEARRAIEKRLAKGRD
jgi:hypothetical protein